MKLLRWTIVLWLCAAALLPAQKDPRTLSFPDSEFAPVKCSSTVLQPSVNLYVLENHEMPVINAYVFVNSGSLEEPAGQEGLYDLTLRLMKSGGTHSLTPEQIEEKLDFLGSNVMVNGGSEYFWLSMWTLSRNFDDSWRIMTDMLLAPRFAPQRLDVEKKKELENIRRRWDDAQRTGMILFRELLFGRQFPDNRRTTNASVNGLTGEQIAAFYDSKIRGRELVVALVGDFDSAKVSEKVRATFENWKPTPRPKLDLPPATLAAKPGIYVVNKDDLTQAIVCMGHLGVNRHDADSVELQILNSIYGTSGFTCRLMKEVRSNRGLAYSVFGHVGAGRDRGLFVNFCQTKNASVAEAITVMKNVLTDITVNPVVAAELATAQKGEINSFVHLFNAPETVVFRTISLKLNGYPDDYLENYLPRIRKVDQARVLAMAKRTMRPEELVVLVVGKQNALLEQLKTLQMPITELPLPKE